jgi:hypothetical protein
MIRQHEPLKALHDLLDGPRIKVFTHISHSLSALGRIKIKIGSATADNELNIFFL